MIKTNAGLVTVLTDNKFSSAQATTFADHYRVISQYTAPSTFGLTGSGFSATLFQNIDTAAYTFATPGTQTDLGNITPTSHLPT